MIAPLRSAPRFATLAEPRPTPPDWTHHAACRYWPELDWIDPTPAQARDCRAVCAACPVRRTCLATALVAAEPWGIWGGLDVDQRADLARTYGLPAPRMLPAHGAHSRYIRHGCRCGACRYTHTLYERERRRTVQHGALQQGALQQRARQQRARQQRTAQSDAAQPQAIRQPARPRRAQPLAT